MSGKSVNEEGGLSVDFSQGTLKLGSSSCQHAQLLTAGLVALPRDSEPRLWPAEVSIELGAGHAWLSNLCKWHFWWTCFLRLG